MSILTNYRLILEKLSRFGKEPDPSQVDDSQANLHQVELTQLDLLPMAIIQVDAEGHICMMNQAAESLLGKPPKGIRLEDWPRQFGFYEADSKTPYPGENLPLVRALHGEGIEPAEEILLRKNENEPDIWLSVSTSLIKDKNGTVNGGVVIFHDLTRRKKIEISREKQIQRIEALYGLSHIIAEAGIDLNQITQLTASFPAKELGDMSLVCLLTSDKKKLRLVAFHDTDPEVQKFLADSLDVGREYELAEGLVSDVIRSGEPVLIPLISHEQLHAMGFAPLQEVIVQTEISSALIVPLIGRNGVLGAITLFRHRDSQPFNIGEQSFLSDAFYRLALAIENCLLFDKLHKETARRLSTKQALAVSQARLHSIFESVPLGLKVMDLNGNILQINPAFMNMLGYEEHEIVGKHYHDFLHAADITQALNLFRDVRDKNITSFRFEHRLLNKEQSIIWVTTLFTLVKENEVENVPAFVVGIVENITEQKHHELEMAELKDRLQNSMELERLHLAQELHDNPMQELYSANYQLEELRSRADPETKETLLVIRSTILEVLKGLRNIAIELRPPTLSSFGLENAIRSHASDFQEKYPNIKTHTSLAHDRQMLPDKVRLALFRVLQQSLTNVIRHAEASEVHIRFQFDAEEATLEISDNGKGFQVPKNWIDLVRQGHYGLAGAAERLSALGGSLVVESEPGKLTTVRASIPMNDSKDDED